MSADAEARALRVIEAIHGHPDDESPMTLSPAAHARMRAAIDQAFQLAWRAARERAKAESQTSSTPRPGLLTMAADALRARIAELQAQIGPTLQLAHRHLETMTDEDLRSLAADLEEVAARRESRP